tara:strand:- start:2602 stop:2766 length:165 start_codon:yes stop_codon:yes gene_type:complete
MFVIKYISLLILALILVRITNAQLISINAKAPIDLYVLRLKTDSVDYFQKLVKN